MKGTARHDLNPIIDQQILNDVLLDAKIQAENLIIADLIHNDLSRVSEPHSVRVSRLFEPRTLSSVIESTFRSDIDRCALIKALFPCGSLSVLHRLRLLS
jgi:anthranilate/para-aminobenzoate synthase component I